MDTRVAALETAVGEGGSVAAQITAEIAKLDKDDEAVAGKYVSAVSEEDGVITVVRADLPDYTETYATIAMLQNMLPKVTSITLGTTWNGSASPYYQDVTLSCVTETSLVTLQPTVQQLSTWQDAGLAFTTLSGNGTVRIYCTGGLPSESMTIQVTVQEVVEV